jgi:hypothetical protein
MASPFRALSPSLLALVVLAMGCDVGLSVVGLGSDDPTGGTDGGSDGGGGLPCDVQMVLENTCWSCHNKVPSGGAPISLASYADLTAVSKAYPGQSLAQRALARMMAGPNDSPPQMPPPPVAAVAAADIATMSAWIKSGTPMGTCMPMMGMDPLNAAPTCSSGFPDDTSSTRGNMQPGIACGSCHPNWYAGTVYSTGHEPDLCDGANGPTANVADAKVTIVGADGTRYPMTVHAPSGNFYYAGTKAIGNQYTVELSYNGKIRKMITPQDSGDCNSCHADQGDQGAPGRITLPQ